MVDKHKCKENSSIQTCCQKFKHGGLKFKQGRPPFFKSLWRTLPFKLTHIDNRTLRSLYSSDILLLYNRLRHQALSFVFSCLLSQISQLLIIERYTDSYPITDWDRTFHQSKFLSEVLIMFIMLMSCDV